jgi:hypothetical protein
LDLHDNYHKEHKFCITVTVDMKKKKMKNCMEEKKMDKKDDEVG